MILKFINRVEELKFLEDRYKNNNFEFFVLYGRRRVGKTETIKEFLINKHSIYFLCDKSGTERNITRFKQKVAEYLNEPIISTSSLDEIFSYLAKKLKDKTIFVLDEFSYLVEKDDSIPSIFQVIVDEILKNTNHMLILCGSSISMMEKGVLSYKSPLYGRKTAHIKLNPIQIESFQGFFPLNTIEKNIEFYSILGGVPFYLEKFSDKESAINNIKKQLMNKEGKLYEEIDFLLREELREPDVYKTILNAISSGSTKTVEIANKSNIKVQDIDKYLKVLIKLGIVKRDIPVTETKSKKSIYFIDDNFFSFYFSFLEPNKSDLELGETKKIEMKLDNDFNSFIGRKFEKLIRSEIFKKTEIFDAEKIGKWWGYYREANKRKEVEIDLVALNQETKEILFCECKWQDKVEAEKILKELKEKAKYVEWPNKKEKEKRKESFAIFAKSFKKKIIQFEGKKVYCIDLKGIEKVLKKRRKKR